MERAPASRDSTWAEAAEGAVLPAAVLVGAVAVLDPARNMRPTKKQRSKRSGMRSSRSLDSVEKRLETL